MNITDKIKVLNRIPIENAAILFLKQNNIGVQFEDGYEIVKEGQQEFAEIDPNMSFYYYDGPLDEKTRGFCKTLLSLDRYFTQADIDKLSRRSGYNVDLYNGSFGCRHQWKRARIKGKIKEGYIPEIPSTGDIKSVAKKSINK